MFFGPYFDNVARLKEVFGFTSTKTEMKSGLAIFSIDIYGGHQIYCKFDVLCIRCNLSVDPQVLCKLISLFYVGYR